MSSECIGNCSWLVLCLYRELFPLWTGWMGDISRGQRWWSEKQRIPITSITQRALGKTLPSVSRLSRQKEKLASLSKYSWKNHIVGFSLFPFLKQIMIWKALMQIQWHLQKLLHRFNQALENAPGEQTFIYLTPVTVSCYFHIRC